MPTTITQSPEEQEAVRHKFAMLEMWQAVLLAAIDAKQVIEREMELRKEVAKLFFNDPTEGTNNLPLSRGWKLKLTHKLDRKLDESALPTVCQKLRDLGFNPDLLFRNKPELVLAEYRTLDDANKAVFDEALTTKPASPTLELVAPKEKK